MQPEEVVIHIGIQKTASSYLQQCFFPKLTDHVLVTRPYTQLNHAWNKLQYGNDSIYKEREVQDELKKINGRRLIISDESLEGNTFGLSNSNRDIIAQRLHTLFPNAKIMILIRDHYDWLFSIYGQYLKAHRSGVKTLQDVIYCSTNSYEWEDAIRGSPGLRNQYFFNTSEFVIHLEACRFSDLISTYKSYFKEVNVYFYEDFISRSVFLFRELFSHYDDRVFQSVKSEKVNERFSATKLKRYMYAKRFYVLKGSTKPTWISKGISSLLSHLDQMNLYELSESKRQLIDGVFVRDCDELNTIHGLRMDKFPGKYVHRYTN